MRFISITVATLALVVACAHTLARDGTSRDFSASGPQHERRPVAITSKGASEGVELQFAQPAQRTTLNRSAAGGGGAGLVNQRNSGAARLPLGAPKPQKAAERNPKTSWLDIKANKPISTVLTGLSLVLGAFLLLAWAVRKRMPKGSARLPDEIIEVLGRTTIAAKPVFSIFFANAATSFSTSLSNFES